MNTDFPVFSRFGYFPSTWGPRGQFCSLAMVVDSSALPALAYGWTLPFGGSFLLTVGASLLAVELLCLQCVEVCFLDTLSHCKQRSSIVSKKAWIVSETGSKLVSKQKLPNTTVSKNPL